jgi:hypothetical protein
VQALQDAPQRTSLGFRKHSLLTYLLASSSLGNQVSDIDTSCLHVTNCLQSRLLEEKINWLNSCDVYPRRCNLRVLHKTPRALIVMKLAIFSVLMIIFLMVGAEPGDHRDSNGQSLESHWPKNDPFCHNIPGNLKTDRLQDIRYQLAAGMREVARELLTDSRPVSNTGP